MVYTPISKPHIDKDMSLKDLGVPVVMEHRVNGTQVRSGQMKFSVHLENWPWKDVNNFIDIDIIMKVPKGRQVVRRSPSAGASRKKPAEFGLGKNATAYFSRKVSTLLDVLVLFDKVHF